MTVVAIVHILFALRVADVARSKRAQFRVPSLVMRTNLGIVTSVSNVNDAANGNRRRAVSEIMVHAYIQSIAKGVRSRRVIVVAQSMVGNVPSEMTTLASSTNDGFVRNGSVARHVK